MAPCLCRNPITIRASLNVTLPSSVTLQASKFLANGHQVLTKVPERITATPSPLIAADKAANNPRGCFIGFDADEARSWHEIPIGKLKGIRFMSIFRFKIWWATHWVGSRGEEVENETQMMLLDRNDQGRPYVLLLPLLEGPFRAALNPGEDDFVTLSVESGSTKVRGSSFRSSLYMAAGDNPFDLIRTAVRAARTHLGTFKLLEEKTPPGIVDKFGWCTWDAFYLTVNPQGIREGIKRLVEGGCPPGMVLIDDGWQSIAHDDDPIDQENMDLRVSGDQMHCRLAKFEENSKFRDYKKEGMGAFVKNIKEEFRTVEYVYIWHALCGYWGGVRPNAANMPYATVIHPQMSQRLKMTMEDLAVDKINENGVGLVPPQLAHLLYQGLHSRLHSLGIDGVKVDVISILEMLSEEYGGRIEVAKAYFKALTASIKKYFKGNGVIASMEHSNDFMFLGTEAITLGRVGDDFWPSDPNGDPYWLQGCHMVHCAYNSVWMGNFIQPDWDMFQSNHPCAEFHGASRAISGGPIYVSDTVGGHDFSLLKRLVLPDGSILRCQFYALPTRDCLFQDPLQDSKTILKIWNVNKYTGVLGLFNCQGGGWCPQTRTNRSAPKNARPLTCVASPKDIEWGSGKRPISLKEVDTYAVYMIQQKKLRLLKTLSDTIEISLDPLSYELLVVSPLREISPERRVRFGVIGLVNMLNAGGAVEEVDAESGENLVRVGVRGSGEMRVYASEKPRKCKIDGEGVEFCYADEMVSVLVPWPNSSRFSVVEYLF